MMKSLCLFWAKILYPQIPEFATAITQNILDSVSQPWISKLFRMQFSFCFLFASNMQHTNYISLHTHYTYYDVHAYWIRTHIYIYEGEFNCSVYKLYIHMAVWNIPTRKFPTKTLFCSNVATLFRLVTAICNFTHS